MKIKFELEPEDIAFFESKKGNPDFTTSAKVSTKKNGIVIDLMMYIKLDIGSWMPYYTESTKITNTEIAKALQDSIVEQLNKKEAENER